MARTKRESDRGREVANLFVLPRPAKSLQNDAGFYAPSEPPFPKKKEQSRLSRLPDCKVGESQGEREPHLGERWRSEREHGEERVDFTVKEGRFQGEKSGQARRASLEKKEGSMSG